MAIKLICEECKGDGKVPFIQLLGLKKRCKSCQGEGKKIQRIIRY
ncbi:hypothetical protein [Bacillus sp. ISL-37]|nr:hypothetical protein [Bacillus sp. ISL-37]